LRKIKLFENFVQIRNKFSNFSISSNNLQFEKEEEE